MALTMRDDSACRGTGLVHLNLQCEIVYGVGEPCPNCWGSGLSTFYLFNLTEDERCRVRSGRMTKAEAVAIVEETV